MKACINRPLKGIPTCFFVSRPREGSFSASGEEKKTKKFVSAFVSGKKLAKFALKKSYGKKKKKNPQNSQKIPVHFSMNDFLFIID